MRVEGMERSSFASGARRARIVPGGEALASPSRSPTQRLDHLARLRGLAQPHGEQHRPEEEAGAQHAVADERGRAVADVDLRVACGGARYELLGRAPRELARACQHEREDLLV